MAFLRVENKKSGSYIRIVESCRDEPVLLGSGIEKESEDKLCTAFKALNPHIIIVQHYGGGSGLLAAEITRRLQGDK
jgi:hypothetical protein